MNSLGYLDYSVIFSLPEEQAAACFWSLFHKFSVRWLVAIELRFLPFEDFMNFIDDVRYAFFEEANVGPEIGGMVSFLSACPGRCRKPKVLIMF